MLHNVALGPAGQMVFDVFVMPSNSAQIPITLLLVLNFKLCLVLNSLALSPAGRMVFVFYFLLFNNAQIPTTLLLESEQLESELRIHQLCRWNLSISPALQTVLSVTQSSY